MPGDQSAPGRKGWDISRSHVPNLEDFLQGLYISQFVSAEPTSAQFSALSARVAANSAKVAVTSATVTSNLLSVLSQAVSVLSQQISVVSQQVSVLSNRVSVVSSLVSSISQAISIFSFIGDNAQMRLYRTSVGEPAATAEWLGVDYNAGDAAVNWRPTHGGS